MTWLITRLAFLVHLVRVFPAVVRGGRLPRRPGDLLRETRLSFQAFTKPAPTPAAAPPAPRPRFGTAGILLLTHNLNPIEGAPLSLLSLARGLAGAGHEIQILSMEDGALRERYEAEGLHVEVSNPLLGIYGEPEYPEYEARLGALRQWVKDCGVRLIFCNTLASFWGVALARTAGIPSVWCIRESVDWRTYFGYLAPPLARDAIECLRTADRLVFVADATRRLFAEFEDARRSRTIHNGLDLPTIETFKRLQLRSGVRSAHGIDQRARVISIIGTTCERKGQIDFLRAARTLTQRGTERLHFYVVGSRRGKYLNDLQSFVREQRLSSVVFVQETPHVYEYYRISDVFVCASYEESFPRVILEAMAFELPIVSTDVYGIPEALTDGFSALLVSPGDTEALASRVAQLLGDPALSERLSTNAYATLKNRFTLGQMVQKYGQLFAECLA